MSFAIAAGAALLAVASLMAQSASTADSLLTQKMGLSAADLLELGRGSAVVRGLATPVREELAYIGVVHIDAPARQFIERFRDIEQFERGPGVPQIARFSSPPRLEDLASLRLPPGDVTALKSCQPGDCDLKLPATAMEQFRDAVDWSSPNAASQANQLMREVILELLSAYQSGGNAALGHYDDGNEPLPIAAQFEALLASSGDPVPVPVSDLLGYLDAYPLDRPAGAEDFFYWSVVEFGLKATIRVNHVMILPLPAPRASGVTYAIAIKQLYASHYFYTTLELRFLVDGGASNPWGSSLISITRSRSDGMTGFRGLFRRPMISRRSGDAIRRYLEHLKQQVESPSSLSGHARGRSTGARSDWRGFCTLRPEALTGLDRPRDLLERVAAKL